MLRDEGGAIEPIRRVVFLSKKQELYRFSRDAIIVMRSNPSLPILKKIFPGVVSTKLHNDLKRIVRCRSI